MRARYRDANGKEHAPHFDRKVDGQRWLDEQTAGLITGQWVDPRNCKITLRQHAAEWQTTHARGGAQTRVADNALRPHVLPMLGERKLVSIRRSDVQGLVNGLAGHLAPNTVAGIYAVLRKVLMWAAEDRLIPANPCRRIVLPRAESKVHVPTVEQADA